MLKTLQCVLCHKWQGVGGKAGAQGMCSPAKESGCWKLLHPRGMWAAGAGGLAAAAGTSPQAVFCVVLAGLGKKEDTSVLMFDAWGSGRRAMLES